MRMRYLFHVGLLAAALFASASFAAAHSSGAMNDSFHLASNPTSTTFTQEVPLAAADWAAASASQQFAANETNHHSVDVSQQVTAFSTAEMLVLDQSVPRFAGLQRTEYIVGMTAASLGQLKSADETKKELGV